MWEHRDLCATVSEERIHEGDFWAESYRIVLPGWKVVDKPLETAFAKAVSYKSEEFQVQKTA